MVAWNFGQWEEHFKALRKAYETGKGDMFLLGLLADRSLDYGDPAQAAEYAAAMRKIDPLSPWATEIDATILYQAGQTREAADLVDEALLKKPDNELLAFFAAAWANARGDQDAAREYLDAGLKSDPEHGYWLVDNFDSQLGSALLLEIYDDRGEADAAAKLYEIASAQAKASPPRATWSNHYDQARLEGAMGNVPAMKQHLARAVELGGQSMYFHGWDTMILKYSDDPEVAALLQRLDGKREEVRQALVAEGLIADSSGGAGG